MSCEIEVPAWDTSFPRPLAVVNYFVLQLRVLRFDLLHGNVGIRIFPQRGGIVASDEGFGCIAGQDTLRLEMEFAVDVRAIDRGRNQSVQGSA